jgi:hypothetical protein
MTQSITSKKDRILKLLRELHSDDSGELKDNLEAIQEIVEEAQQIKSMLEDDINANK